LCVNEFGNALQRTLHGNGSIRESGRTQLAPESINTGFALRSCLPAPMHPKPLVRITAHVVLDHLRKERGIGRHIGSIISGTRQRERGIESDSVLSCLPIPDRKRRHHCSVGSQRHTRHPAGSASWVSKKIYEHTLG